MQFRMSQNRCARRTKVSLLSVYLTGHILFFILSQEVPSYILFFILSQEATSKKESNHIYGSEAIHSFNFFLPQGADFF